MSTTKLNATIGVVVVLGVNSLGTLVPAKTLAARAAARVTYHHLADKESTSTSQVTYQGGTLKPYIQFQKGGRQFHVYRHKASNLSVISTWIRREEAVYDRNGIQVSELIGEEREIFTFIKMAPNGVEYFESKNDWLDELLDKEYKIAKGTRLFLQNNRPAPFKNRHPDFHGLILIGAGGVIAGFVEGPIIDALTRSIDALDPTHQEQTVDSLDEKFDRMWRCHLLEHNFSEDGTPLEASPSDDGYKLQCSLAAIDQPLPPHRPRWPF